LFSEVGEERKRENDEEGESIYIVNRYVNVTIYSPAQLLYANKNIFKISSANFF
jgi:hypothetical protein